MVTNMIFQSDLSSFFNVTGLFNSDEAANHFLSNNPDSGVIATYDLIDKSQLIVVCSNKVCECQPGEKLSEICFSESGSTVPLSGSNIEINRFFKKLK